MSQVNFIHPYGLLALVIIGRTLRQISGNKVLLSHLKLNVHQYLERMDLCNVGRGWLKVDIPLQKNWSRDPLTTKLLELTLISSLEDIEAVVLRVEKIYNECFSISHLNNLISVISELSTNLFEHSGDKSGCILIQKFKIKDQAIIRLAVGDLGCGIPGNITAHYKEDVVKNTLDCLIEVMYGKTTRLSGRGGLGLRQVERIIGMTRGYLWIRSHDAAIASYGPGKIQGFPNLAFIPGTQISVEYNSTDT